MSDVTPMDCLDMHTVYWQLSARHAGRLYWVPGHAGVRGNEIADWLARAVLVSGLLGLSSALGSPGRI